MKKCIIIVSIIAVVTGGLLVGGACSCTSTAGPFNIDLSPAGSVFGGALLFLGLWGLMAKIKKNRKPLLAGMVVYGILLAIFCLYVRDNSQIKLEQLYKNEAEFVDVLPPNGLNIAIACISVFGLIIICPFIIWNNPLNSIPVWENEKILSVEVAEYGSQQGNTAKIIVTKDAVHSYSGIHGKINKEHHTATPNSFWQGILNQCNLEEFAKISDEMSMTSADVADIKITVETNKREISATNGRGKAEFDKMYHLIFNSTQ